MISALGASYYVGVDGFSILLILLTALVAWIGVIASWDETRTRVKEFYALILTLQAGLLGVFMSLDFLQIFLFWAAAVAAPGTIEGLVYLRPEFTWAVHLRVQPELLLQLAFFSAWVAWWAGPSPAPRAA